MKITFVPALLLCWTLLSSNVFAYCVYNKTAHKNMTFLQNKFNTDVLTEGLSKTSVMIPSGKECCPYTNSDCSRATKPDALLIMEIYVPTILNNRFTMPAGGWVEVANDANNADNVIISVFNADGSVFETANLDQH